MRMHMHMHMHMQGAHACCARCGIVAGTRRRAPVCAFKKMRVFLTAAGEVCLA